MDEDTDDARIERGAAYRHDDGRVEIVFEAAAGRVLTVTEYPSRDAFRAAVAGTEDAGDHQGVADLPPAESFRGHD
jgi:hypothetical protein